MSLSSPRVVAQPFSYCYCESHSYLMSTRPIHEMEAKWQARWEAEGTYRASKTTEASEKEKFYGLIEFPYPSGEGLHVGHPRSYTAIDLVTRKRRMEGKNVLYPIGWDAFGLPTENFAIKHKIPPSEATRKNVANFTRQIKSLGFGFDWSREVDTTDPAYYKWTQWQFLQFVKAGLAYKAASTINWCPRCKIGLANEEAQGGVCERCGNPVEKREKAQWMIKITKYAERLLKDLDTVDYLEKIKKQQIDWIGKSEGAEIQFAIEGRSEKMTVFTTRPDTLFGVTYVVLAPEHELVSGWIHAGTVKNAAAVSAYREQVKSLSDIDRTSETKEKTGIVLEGVFAINPVNEERIPVWIADYVLASYGTGAVMAVPAHDERDYTFAEKFGLPIKHVVAPCVTVAPPFEPKEGKPWSKVKSVVTAIIYRPRTDEYLVLETSDARHTFVGGGVDEGETPEQAMIREIQEETGYQNPTLISVVIPALYGRGYKPRKDVNCFDWDKSFYLELRDETQAEIAQTEKASQTVLWKKADEVASFLNIGTHELIWKHFREKTSPCFTEAGFALQSEFLNELPTAEAKEEIIAWLEEKGVGKRMTTYRLRDWVFSRQRYWGEPIPLVHCNACAVKKQKVLLIHGFEGSAETNWFPWMKTELESRGFEVFAPTMSTAKHPKLKDWMQELKPFIEQMGEDDIIVGHSLGSKAALHLVEQANKKIGHLYLVASAIGQVPERDWDQFRQEWEGSDIDALKAFWEAPLNWDKLSELVYNKTLILSDDDPYIKPYTHEKVPAGWFVQTWHGFEHFGQRQIPELLETILTSKATGWIPLPDTQLPLTLPSVEAYEPTDTGESPLAKIRDWVETTCPRCGGSAERETDTMPNWAGSSWYFLRYCDPKNDKEFASAEALKYWMPVDLYNGGMEHTTLHLLYSRFWHKFLYDMGYIPKECGSEPYRMRRSHNMILGEGGVKMSKSKGNVINPDDVVKEYGADVFRLYEMFIGPYDQPATWDTSGIEGVRRFLEKVWNIFVDGKVVEATSDLETLYHQSIKKVSEGIDGLQFNTCISQLMILTNAFQELGGVPASFRKGALQLLAPFAPHLASELWEREGFTEDLHKEGWPVYDKVKLTAATFELVVQVNGKLRDRFTVSSDISEMEAKTLALASTNIQKWLEGKEPQKIVYIPGRLVSIVV
jgi:leucyl-tRNA synthetase/predicted alpha/beta hydrolase family esterase